MFLRLIASAALAWSASAGAANAGECPGNPGAIGTSRIITVDPARQRRVGLNQYDETLALGDHEAVLTFDDGPLPPYTGKVLDALAAECVKATFFLVGQMARAYPGLVQREYREGHTIGTHTEHHPHLNRGTASFATKEIADGIASVRSALGGTMPAPFFRFPYLDDSKAAESSALRLGLSIWSTDFHASDWLLITPEAVTAIAMKRLEENKRGVLMLHDIHQRTVLAVPMILAELKKRGYSIVQAVPAGSDYPKSVAIPYKAPAAN